MAALSLPRDIGELGAVVADVGHFMGDDEVMLRVHRGLNVVANEPGALAVRRHGPRIGVGQRDLSVRRGLDERLHRLQRARTCRKPCRGP